MLQTEVLEKQRTTAEDTELAHYVCMEHGSDFDIALCSTDVSDLPWGLELEGVFCTVCVETDICPICGYNFNEE